MYPKTLLIKNERELAAIKRAFDIILSMDNDMVTDDLWMSAEVDGTDIPLGKIHEIKKTIDDNIDNMVALVVLNERLDCIS